MTGRPNDQRFAMLQCSRGDFSDGVGVTEIDSHIAIFHRQFDWVAKITPRDDVDFWIGTRKGTNSFSHAPNRADEQYTHLRVLHLRKSSLPS
jgi:hypothetical protein